MTGTSNLPILAMRLALTDLVDSSSFPPEQKKQVDVIAAAVDLDDSTTAMTFGIAPQKTLNECLDALLVKVRTDEAGMGGALAVELSDGVNMMKIGAMRKEMDGFTLASVPVIGPFFSQIRAFNQRKARFLTHIDTIVEKAELRRNSLIEDSTRLDVLLRETESHIVELGTYIAGGERGLLRGREEFEQRRTELEKRPDALVAAKLHDFAAQINAFETRLVRMKMAYTEALISMPQIRITQEAGRIEMQNIMDTLLFDLPRLKHAVVRVAALQNIRTARREDAQRREASRKIAELGADLLHEAYTESKKSQGDVEDDVQALANVANKLVATVRSGIEIDKENQEKRRKASEHLIEAKKSLVAALQNVDDGRLLLPGES